MSPVQVRPSAQNEQADRRLDEVPQHWRLEIETFFDPYEEPEGVEGATGQGRRGIEDPWSAIEEAQGCFRERAC